MVKAVNYQRGSQPHGDTARLWVKLFFARYQNQILAKPGVYDTLIPYTESSPLMLPVNTVAPVNLQFLVGQYGDTVLRLPLSATVTVALKATPSHLDTQRLAVTSALTRPGGDTSTDFYTGEIDLRSTQLLALLDAKTGQKPGVSVPAVLTVSFKLSGETDAQYKTCLPCPVMLYSTGFSVSDTAPTIV